MTSTRVLITILILALIGATGWVFLDQTLFAPIAVSTGTPTAPTLEVATASPTEAQNEQSDSPTTTASLYRIDATQSGVRYEVGETLFNENNRIATAIGRTSGVAGEILVDFAQPSNSQIGEIVIDVSQFTSDESRRDNFIRREGLESSTYPYATFVTTAIEGLPDQVAVSDELTFAISGDLTVKETTRPMTWNVTMQVEEDRLVGSATTEILMSDFGVGPLQLPMLATEDLVTLTFDFVAVPAEG